MNGILSNYLNRAEKLGIVPGLERMKSTLKLLDNPQNKIKTIHIAGTNGKGSTTQFIYSILREAGYDVAVFSSPAIVDDRDGITINSKSIPKQEYERIASQIVEVIEKNSITLTKFELLTAIGFQYFAISKVDFAVIEVGMGGLEDSTNVIEKPELSVITNIGIDHTNFLGDTIEEIAFQKAGIIKSNSKVVSYHQNEARKVLEEKAKQEKVPLVFVDESKISVSKIDYRGSVFSYGEYENLETKLIGLNQIKNCALAIEAIKVLKQKYNISDENIYSGIKKTKIECRFEVVSKDPITVIDGAHNIQGVNSLVQNLALVFDRKMVRFVFGSLADKDYEGALDATYLRAKEYYFVTPDSPRALNAFKLKEVADSKGITSQAFESVNEALEKAIDQSSYDDVIVVFGSFYHAYDAREYMKRRKNE